MPTNNINAFGLILNAKEVDGVKVYPQATQSCYAHPAIRQGINVPYRIENAVPFQTLEDLLLSQGGEIVSVDNLSAYETALARQGGHVSELEGKWYAWVPPKLNCKG